MLNQDVYCKESRINRNKISFSNKNNLYKKNKKILDYMELFLVYKTQEILLKLVLIVQVILLNCRPQIKKNKKHLVLTIPFYTIIYRNHPPYKLFKSRRSYKRSTDINHDIMPLAK
jgi:hypothetical protein